MAYRKKLIILISIIASLSLIYALTHIFDPEKSGSRAAAYSWLDAGQSSRISGIVIDDNVGDKIELTKRENLWYVSHNNTDYPARKIRVEDLIDILVRRAPYPLHSTGAASHERLGLSESNAPRITVYGEALVRGQPQTLLLDLLVGNENNTGQRVYLRKSGQNEVRSGDNYFMPYIPATLRYWQNFRLFPESEAGLDAGSVQRLSVTRAPDSETQVFSRWNREWVISGMNVVNPDMSKVDSYVLSILNTEGEDFEYSISSDDPVFNYSRIVLELSDGSVKTIRLSEPDESEALLATVSGSNLVYRLTRWTSQGIFRSAVGFEQL
ncbi:MAG: DUF4340 domain-containing protein [Treponema sp.]|nr:DUF4340 domain-containing protein [Treponema sp.]